MATSGSFVEGHICSWGKVTMVPIPVHKVCNASLDSDRQSAYGVGNDQCFQGWESRHWLGESRPQRLDLTVANGTTLFPRMQSRNAVATRASLLRVWGGEWSICSAVLARWSSAEAYLDRGSKICLARLAFDHKDLCASP